MMLPGEVSDNTVRRRRHAGLTENDSRPVYSRSPLFVLGLMGRYLVLKTSR